MRLMFFCFGEGFKYICENPRKPSYIRQNQGFGGMWKVEKNDKKCYQNLDAVLIQFFNDFELILGSFWRSKIAKKCTKIRFEFWVRFWRVPGELAEHNVRPRGLPRIPFQGILNRRFIFDLRIRRNEGLPRNRGWFSHTPLAQGPDELPI